MQVLVTGSSGFIGSLLLNELKKKGYLVKEFDLEQEKSILNLDQLVESMQGVDAVVHCAAILDEESQKLFEVNVKGTENVLEAAVKAKVKRVVHLSSVGVFGKTDGPLNEESKKQPQTGYEKSKWEAEKIVESYQELIPVTVIRPALVTGTNYYWGKIIKIAEKDFPLVGSGENKWQIVHVKDVVQAIILCLEKPESEGEIYIVAEAKGATLREMQMAIRDGIGMTKPLRQIPLWVAVIGAFFLFNLFKNNWKENIDYASLYG